MNHYFECHPTAYDGLHSGLQSGFGAIGHDLGVDLALALQESKDRGFVPGTAASFAWHSAGTEIGFVHFDLTAGKRRLMLTFLSDTDLSDTDSNLEEKTVHGFALQARQHSYIRGG
jgi:hypothetical protein